MEPGKAVSESAERLRKIGLRSVAELVQLLR